MKRSSSICRLGLPVPAPARDLKCISLGKIFQFKKFDGITAQKSLFLGKCKVFSVHDVLHGLGKVAIPVAVIRCIKNCGLAICGENTIQAGFF